MYLGKKKFLHLSLILRNLFVNFSTKSATFPSLTVCPDFHTAYKRDQLKEYEEFENIINVIYQDPREALATIFFL